jgi:molybdopterin converting factor subunit 1
MRVHVLYFGVLKDVIGHRDAVMDVPEGASVADLLALHPKAGVAVWDSIAVAVNQEYARADDVLKDGDEVALLPPVSGGVDVLAMDDLDMRACRRGEEVLRRCLSKRETYLSG